MAGTRREPARVRRLKSWEIVTARADVNLRVTETPDRRLLQFEVVGSEDGALVVLHLDAESLDALRSALYDFSLEPVEEESPLPGDSTPF